LRRPSDSDKQGVLEIDRSSVGALAGPLLAESRRADPSNPHLLARTSLLAFLECKWLDLSAIAFTHARGIPAEALRPSSGLGWRCNIVFDHIHGGVRVHVDTARAVEVLGSISIARLN